MTSHRTNLPDEATLDQQWDDFLTGDAPPNLESTVAALRPGTLGRAPSRMFVGQLRDLIATAAGERVHTSTQKSSSTDRQPAAFAATGAGTRTAGRGQSSRALRRRQDRLNSVGRFTPDRDGGCGRTVSVPRFDWDWRAYGRRVRAGDPGRANARRRSRPHRRPTWP